MSYEPTQWKAGDTVTSAKLNKIEQGIAAGGGSVFIVNTTPGDKANTSVLDKTVGEILDAFLQGPVIIKYADDTDQFSYMYIVGIIHQIVGYMILMSQQGLIFWATNLDDYPIMDQG